MGRRQGRVAALKGLPPPALTGRTAGAWWVGTTCRDRLWILLYVRTVTVTAALVFDYPKRPDIAVIRANIAQLGQASTTQRA